MRSTASRRASDDVVVSFSVAGRAANEIGGVVSIHTKDCVARIEYGPGGKIASGAVEPACRTDVPVWRLRFDATTVLPVPKGGEGGWWMTWQTIASDGRVVHSRSDHLGLFLDLKEGLNRHVSTPYAALDDPTALVVNFVATAFARPTYFDKDDEEEGEVIAPKRTRPRATGRTSMCDFVFVLLEAVRKPTIYAARESETRTEYAALDV